MFISTITSKIMCGFLTITLLSVSAPTVNAGISAGGHTLSPKLRLSQENFKDRYLEHLTTVVLRNTSQYVEQQISVNNDRSLQSRPDRVQISEKHHLDVLIVSIPGLMKNTGQISHIIIDPSSAGPVIYVDDRYYYNEKVIKNDKDGIAKWEGKRIELGLDHDGMRKWIKTAQEARTIAGRSHNTPVVDRDVHLMQTGAAVDLLDWQNIHAAYLAYNEYCQVGNASGSLATALETLPDWLSTPLSEISAEIQISKLEGELHETIKKGIDSGEFMVEIEDMRGPPEISYENPSDYRTRELLCLLYDYNNSPAVFSKKLLAHLVIKLLKNPPTAGRLIDVDVPELLDMSQDMRGGSYEKTHVRFTSEYAALISKELGLRKELVDLIEKTSLVHDIGGLAGLPIAVENIEGIIARNNQLIKKYGLPTKSSKESSLKALEELLKKRPELSKYVNVDENRFYVNMANVIAGAHKEDGHPITYEELMELTIEFSHELLGPERLLKNGIILTTAEKFLIDNHFFYPSTFEGLEHIADSSGLTVNELKLLLDILVFCDVWENGNNTARLWNRRGIEYQPLKKTFDLFDQFYGDKGVGHEPKTAMARMIARKDPKIVSLLSQQRPADSRNFIRPEEYEEVARVLHETLHQKRTPAEQKRNILYVPSDEIVSNTRGYIRTHIERVARIALRIGERMALSRHEMNILRAASYGHDVGPFHSEENYFDLLSYGVQFSRTKDMTLREFTEDAFSKKKAPLTDQELALIEDAYRHGDNFLEFLGERYFLPDEVAFIIKYHKNYGGFIRNIGSIEERISIDVDRLHLLLDILVTADMFETANNEPKLRLSGQSGINTFGQSLEKDGVFDKIYREKGLTNMEPKKALMELLLEQDQEILRAVYESRGEEELLPGDVDFMRSYAFRRNDKKTVGPDQTDIKQKDTTETTPADFLNAANNNDKFLSMALSVKGIDVSAISATLNLSNNTIGPVLEALISLGLLSETKETGNYRLSDMMIGPDKNYSRTMINAVVDIRSSMWRGAAENHVLNKSIAPENIPFVKELIKATVISETDKMNRPAIPENKVLWHIIDYRLMGTSQSQSFAQKINNASKSSNEKERIWIMRRGDTIDQSMTYLKSLSPEAIFDVALADKKDIVSVPPDINGIPVKMLVFERADPSDFFTHIQGVVSALRALHLEREEVVPALLRIYSVINGASYPGTIPSTDDLENAALFAQNFVFHLPPAGSFPIEDIQKINQRLLKILIAA